MEFPKPEYPGSHGAGSQPARAGFNPGEQGQHTFIRMTDAQPTSAAPVMIRYPVNEGQPKTQCTLILSTLSAIFCFLWCGLMAMGVTWQARLQVLDGKFAHARHSLSVATILNVVALLFGLLFWAMTIWYLALITGRY